MASDDADRAESFGSCVVREFAFLEALGFDLVEVSAYAAIWQSGGRTFTIVRDWRDGLIETAFRVSESGRRFGVSHALTATGQADRWPGHGWAARRPETIEKYVAEISSMVRDNLADFLQAPDPVWENARRVASSEADEYGRNFRSNQLRAHADSARTAGNWHDVAKAYEQLVNAGFDLTKAEEARLRLARRRTSLS